MIIFRVPYYPPWTVARKGGTMREPTIKNIYSDSIRNITFEVLYYTPMEEKKILQVLDEYYRRYGEPVPKDGTTVRVICDERGPRAPIN